MVCPTCDRGLGNVSADAAGVRPDLIQPQDKILVAISGGKDSFALYKILDLHRRRSPFEFSLTPIFVDPGWDENAGEEVQKRLIQYDIKVEALKPPAVLLKRDSKCLFYLIIVC